jgi:hypothetical protein
MLATTLDGLATVAATTGEGEGRKTTTLGGLLIGLLRHLEDLGQGLALVRLHRLLDVRHPRATLATGHCGGGSGFDCFSCYGCTFHFVLTRENF